MNLKSELLCKLSFFLEEHVRTKLSFQQFSTILSVSAVATPGSTASVSLRPLVYKVHNLLSSLNLSLFHNHY